MSDPDDKDDKDDKDVKDVKDDKDGGPVLDGATLEAWPAAEPPGDFADRVLAARTAVAPARRRTALYVVAGATGMVAVAAVLIVSLRPRGTVERGTVVAATRTEARLGERAVLVAEPGASLRWTVDDSGAARITQDSGEVFYRVEHGGPFVVATPAGDVSVLGTCFRVEVTEMRIGKQGLAGAAIGAAVTAVVMVTAYEGKVLLANEKGKTQIAAGERATAAAGSAPGSAVDARSAKRPAIAIAEAPPPPEGASKEELLVRDAEQRKQIAKLEARVAELSHGGGDGDKRADLDPRRFSTHPTHDELVEMAKSCTVSYDSPALDGDPTELPPKIAERASLSPDETVAVQKIIDQMNNQLLAQLRAIYTEVTGNKAVADQLSAHAIINEVEQKTGEGDAARKEIASERAGLVPVPADLATRSPSERMLRALSSEGDDLEKAIGQVIGPDRAAALRGQGWGQRAMMSGCRDGTEDETR